MSWPSSSSSLRTSTSSVAAARCSAGTPGPALMYQIAPNLYIYTHIYIYLCSLVCCRPRAVNADLETRHTRSPRLLPTSRAAGASLGFRPPWSSASGCAACASTLPQCSFQPSSASDSPNAREYGGGGLPHLLQLLRGAEEGLAAFLLQHAGACRLAWLWHAMPRQMHGKIAKAPGFLTSGRKRPPVARRKVPRCKCKTVGARTLHCPGLIILVRVDEELQAVGVLQRHGDGGSAVRLLPNIGLVEHQVPRHLQVAFGKSLAGKKLCSGEHV